MKYGKDCKLYIGDKLFSSDPGDPVGMADITWQPDDMVQDSKLIMEAGEADITARISNGWKATAAALLLATVEFNIVSSTWDPGFISFRNSFIAGTALSVAAMDGDIDDEDSEGLVGNMHVTKFTRTENQAGIVIYEVTLKPHSETAYVDGGDYPTALPGDSRWVRLDGANITELSMGGHKITNLADGTGPQDAATVSQLESISLTTGPTGQPGLPVRLVRRE